MENINKVFNVLYLEDDLNINPSEISLDDKSVIRLVIARTCEEARNLYSSFRFDALYS